MFAGALFSNLMVFVPGWALLLVPNVIKALTKERKVKEYRRLLSEKVFARAKTFFKYDPDSKTKVRLHSSDPEIVDEARVYREADLFRMATGNSIDNLSLPERNGFHKALTISTHFPVMRTIQGQFLMWDTLSRPGSHLALDLGLSNNVSPLAQLIKDHQDSFKSFIDKISWQPNLFRPSKDFELTPEEQMKLKALTEMDIKSLTEELYKINIPDSLQRVDGKIEPNKERQRKLNENLCAWANTHLWVVVPSIEGDIVSPELIDPVDNKPVTIDAYVAMLPGHEAVVYDRASNDSDKKVPVPGAPEQVSVPKASLPEKSSSTLNAVTPTGGIDMNGIDVDATGSSGIMMAPFDVREFKGFTFRILSIDRVRDKSDLLVALNDG